MRLRKLFEDKDGKIVIAQAPNIPIVLAIGFYLMGFSNYHLLNGISFLGFTLALSYWSYLEITSGVNAFRRMLGALAFLFIFWRIIYQVLQML